MITSPVTPTWSPRSTRRFHSSSALGADPVEREHRLQLGAVAVPQGGEAELAGVADEDHPAGDRDLCRRWRCRSAGRRSARGSPRAWRCGGSRPGTARRPRPAAGPASPGGPASAREGRRRDRSARRSARLTARFLDKESTPVRPERTQPPRGRYHWITCRAWSSTLRPSPSAPPPGDYDRFRPPYPLEAVALGADRLRRTGPGGRSRAPAPASSPGWSPHWATRSSPVEPDPGMRARLVAATPGSHRAGGQRRGDPAAGRGCGRRGRRPGVPLVRPERAHPEIARVLRPGGIFAPIWNLRDESAPLGRRALADHRAASPAPAGTRRRRPEPEPDFGALFGPASAPSSPTAITPRRDEPGRAAAHPLVLPHRRRTGAAPAGAAGPGPDRAAPRPGRPGELRAAVPDGRVPRPPR